MLDKLTDRARKILKIANEEAKRLNSDGIGTEHLLLGILDEGGGVAFKALSQMGVDIKGMKAEIEKMVKPLTSKMQVAPAMVVPWTPRAKRVFELAEEEAFKVMSPLIATEHLLLAVFMEGEGIGAQALMLRDITEQRLRDKVEEIVGQTGQGQVEARQKLSEIQARIATPIPTPGPCTIKILLFTEQASEGKPTLVLQDRKLFANDVVTMKGVPFDKKEAIAASIAKDCGAVAYLIEPHRDWEYVSGRPWSR